MNTLGTIARKHGIPIWMVRRLFERGLLPEPGRIGMYRVIPDKDLPKVERALRKAGYIGQGSAATSTK